MRTILFISSLFFISFAIPCSVSAHEILPQYENALKMLHPHVDNVTWSKRGTYEIATFYQNDRELAVWFNHSAQWVMNCIYVPSTVYLPKPVAENFSKSLMGDQRINYIAIVSFPKQPTTIVIEVNAWNSSDEAQLFYAPSGKLLQTFNVQQGEGELYPSCVCCCQCTSCQ